MYIPNEYIMRHHHRELIREGERVHLVQLITGKAEENLRKHGASFFKRGDKQPKPSKN